MANVQLGVCPPELCLPCPGCGSGCGLATVGLAIIDLVVLWPLWSSRQFGYSLATVGLAVVLLSIEASIGPCSGHRSGGVLAAMVQLSIGQ